MLADEDERLHYESEAVKELRGIEVIFHSRINKLSSIRHKKFSEKESNNIYIIIVLVFSLPLFD